MDWTNAPQAALRASLATIGLSLVLATLPAAAGVTELANVPLANATPANILPNLMLDLDNSGSMAWTYMPDHVRNLSNGTWGKYCRGRDAKNTLIVCEQGDPPFFASDFNSQYYNPEIRYVWPVQANGSRLPDKMSPANTAYTTAAAWKAVPSDGYGVQDIDDTSGEVPSSTSNPCRTDDDNNPCTKTAATVNLVESYPERVWCTSDNDDAYGTNCKQALQVASDGTLAYTYPDGVNRRLKVRYGPAYYYNVTVEWCSAVTNGFGRAGTCQEKKTDTYKYVRYSNWSRVDITSATTFPLKAVTRTDCAGTRCTYAEEMSNFANWFAWYRTRAQMTKSAMGLAFRDVRGVPVDNDLTDANYLHARVGLTTISGSIKLQIDDFGTTQKDSFFTNLYGFNPMGGTPLRASLDAMGKMYKGDKKSDYGDPVKFSCQKNFTILATDGYWNGNFTDAFGDVDGADDVSKPSWDGNATAQTLADIAYYYYHTDLRPDCTGQAKDVCKNNVPPSGSKVNVDDVAQHQHMTTFTIGLGVDGTLDYDPNYKNSTEGDYFDITQGTKYWPAPSSNTPETIDDLWHTAVNGRGTYFSARNPASLESGLRRAFSTIDSATGSGAAAATSNLQPTATDNFIFVATYRTLKWDGDINAYTVNLSSGAISDAATWTAEPLLRAKITNDGDSDTRTIYTGSYNANGTITRKLFNTGTGGLSATQLAQFTTSGLSQAAGWTQAQTSAATATSLVKYLRGQDRNEDQDRDEGYPSYTRLYRDREKVLGDIVHSQPVYVKAPPYDFGDVGYADFKTANASRNGVLYAAANDGMLHAFDGDTGEELWAYVPQMLFPKLAQLADVNYSSKHLFYLDGPLTITDAKVGNTWKTILIGAMGKGGRGYYALDVTDPGNPQPMWDFTAANNPNVGYTYGTPFVTKKSDGTWVAVVTSGYDNIPEENGTKYPGGTGFGYVFELDLTDGHVLTTISTGEGATDNPSGLARLNVKVADFSTDNTALIAYGGDLFGNMWRFNLNTASATKLAALGSAKPIMAAPEIAEFDTYKAVYFGTGQYLGKGDLDDTGTQTLYGLKDDGSSTITGTTDLIEQTASNVANNETRRDISSNPVEWSSKKGWFLNLPDTGERVTIEPQLYFGTLVFASTVPSISECQPGGYSWMYQLDYKTGGNVKPGVPGGMKFTSPIVGQTVSKLPSGTPIIHVVTADGKKPDPIELQLGPNGGGTGPRRALWRELTN